MSTRLHVLLFIVVLGGADRCAAQHDNADKIGQSADLATQLARVPATPEELAAQQATVEARLQALRPTTQPTAEATDEAQEAVRAAREGLYKAWEAYSTGLRQLGELRERIAVLSSEAHIAQIAEERTGHEAAARQLAVQPEPTTASAEEVAAAAKEQQALAARVRALGDAQAQRKALLAAGFQQQNEELDAELKDLRRQRQDAQLAATSRPATATAPAAAELPAVKRERLDVQIATAELALEQIALEQRAAKLEVTQNESLLKTLREKLDAVTRRHEVLTAIEGRSRLERLELQRRLATNPAERALLDLKLFGERVLQRYFRNREQIAALEERLAAGTVERLAEEVMLSRTNWDRAVKSLSVRRHARALELHAQANEELAEARDRLVDWRTQLGKIAAELQEIQSVRELALQRFGELEDKLDRALTAKDTTKRARLETEVAEARTTLDEQTRVAVKKAEELVARADEQVTLTQGHVAYLDDVEQAIHWARITSRDSGLMGADWTQGGTELSRLLSAPTVAGAGTPGDPASADLDRELFGQGRDDREAARELLRAAGEHVVAAPAGAWIGALAALVVAAVLGVVLYRVARRRGVHLARVIEDDVLRAQDEQHAITYGISARVNLLLWNMLGDLAIPLLLAGVVAVVAVRIIPEEAVWRPLATPLAALALAAVLLRAVHHLFEAFSPAHRPLPCSDAVAQHYRWWLSAIILYSLVVLTPVTLLYTADLAPTLRAVVLEIYKAGLLLLLLLFLLRKERVLGRSAGKATRWGFLVASIVYPAVMVGVAALLVLQILGYGVLVAFVGMGVLVTGGIVLVVGTVAEYLVDVINRYFAPAAGALVPQAPAAEDGEAATARELELGRVQYASGLLRSLVRLLGLGVIVVLIIKTWDIPIQEDWLNWRVLGLGGLAALIALVIDQVMYSALFTLQGTGRLPASTARLVRRWGRGVLIALVVLTWVALAGFEIKGLWAFLTTLLAMVAIGFVAVWSILSNILATVVILIWRPFNVGERVEIMPEGLEGQVVDLNFMYTILRSDKGTLVSVPNNLFAQRFIRRSVVRGQPERTLAEQLAADKPLEEQELGCLPPTQGRKRRGT